MCHPAVAAYWTTYAFSVLRLTKTPQSGSFFWFLKIIFAFCFTHSRCWERGKEGLHVWLGMQALEPECPHLCQALDLSGCGNLDRLLNCLVWNENEIIILAHEAKARIKWYLCVKFPVHSKNSIKCQLWFLCFVYEPMNFNLFGEKPSKNLPNTSLPVEDELMEVFVNFSGLLVIKLSMYLDWRGICQHHGEVGPSLERLVSYHVCLNFSGESICALWVNQEHTGIS